jgi:hypothetical protein
MLKNDVESAIDIEQRKVGKELTRDQKQKIMHDIVDRKVLLNYWGPDPTKIAAMVTDPEDRKKAYVPLAQVPAAAITAGLNYVRGISPATGKLTEPQLRALAAPRIQRAYALRLMGGTQAEIEAAMKGEE